MATSTQGPWSYNSLRRVLPTAADVLDFDDVMAAGIGKWQDNSAVTSGRKRRPAIQPIAKHNAEDKIRTSGEHKRWIVWGVGRDHTPREQR